MLPTAVPSVRRPAGSCSATFRGLFRALPLGAAFHLCALSSMSQPHPQAFQRPDFVARIQAPFATRRLWLRPQNPADFAGDYSLGEGSSRRTPISAVAHPRAPADRKRMVGVSFHRRPNLRPDLGTSTMNAFSEFDQAPNHALQRTGSAVTAPAADHHRLSTHRQVPRPLRLSLSLGSLGHSTHHP